MRYFRVRVKNTVTGATFTHELEAMNTVHAALLAGVHSAVASSQADGADRAWADTPDAFIITDEITPVTVL